MFSKDELSNSNMPLKCKIKINFALILMSKKWYWLNSPVSCQGSLEKNSTLWLSAMKIVKRWYYFRKPFLACPFCAQHRYFLFIISTFLLLKITFIIQVHLAARHNGWGAMETAVQHTLALEGEVLQVLLSQFPEELPWSHLWSNT